MKAPAGEIVSSINLGQYFCRAAVLLMLVRGAFFRRTRQRVCFTVRR